MDRQTRAGNTKNIPACDQTDAASMPTQSMSSTAQGFRDGIGHVAKRGTFEVPGNRRNSVLTDVRPGIWSPGSVKSNS